MMVNAQPPPAVEATKQRNIFSEEESQYSVDPDERENAIDLLTEYMSNQQKPEKEPFHK